MTKHSSLNELSTLSNIAETVCSPHYCILKTHSCLFLYLSEFKTVPGT